SVPLDAMYFLQDLLQVENLRSRSFAYLGNVAASLVTLRRPQAEAEASRRTRVILLAYGTLAVVVLVSLLSLMARAALDLYTRLLGPIGTAGVVAFAALWFQRSIVAGAKWAWRALSPGLFGTRARTAVTAAVAGAAVLAVALVRPEVRVLVPACLVPERSTEVRAGGAATIAEVLVSEGGAVALGDPLVRL